MATSVALVRHRDPRVVAYVVTAAATAVVGLLTARVALVAFAAPFAVALALTRPWPNATAAAVEVSVTERRVVEGDVFRGRATVQLQREIADATVELILAPPTDLGVTVEDRDALAGAGIGDAAVGFRCRPTRWGRYTIAPAMVRVRRPDGFGHLEGALRSGRELVVLPTLPRLDRILAPRSSRAAAGQHLSRRSLGAGLDFAELRDYRPGDRRRDLNRAASRRTGTPIVNAHHPERSGEVVVLLDTLVDNGFDLSEPARQCLVTMARAAWALARVHLAAQDRVGLATIGRIPIWLAPQAGARARYAILESLLTVGNVLDGRTSLSDSLDAGRVPPAALVVYVSPLWTGGYASTIERLAARGRQTVVLRIETTAMLPAPPDAGAALAMRVFELGADNRAEGLRRTGIPVVTWDPNRALGDAVGAAVSLQRRRGVKAAR